MIINLTNSLKVVDLKWIRCKILAAYHMLVRIGWVVDVVHLLKRKSPQMKRNDAVFYGQKFSFIHTRKIHQFDLMRGSFQWRWSISGALLEWHPWLLRYLLARESSFYSSLHASFSPLLFQFSHSKVSLSLFSPVLLYLSRFLLKIPLQLTSMSGNWILLLFLIVVVFQLLQIWGFSE